MGRKEKPHIEWRILTHEDDVKVLKSACFEFAELIMGCPALDVNPARTPAWGSTPDEQIVQFHVTDFMIPLLCFEQQDKSRVFVDVDFFNGVHHDPDSKRPHIRSPPQTV